ncbi:conserved hypothetical protein [Talaromyces stipitatus ATCC 10500]|uniref:Condensation domain-containing protein n=1 Tax=Talaromyces stipitatus (strain ATCC 10500 / CBS 375.48 / QM 6759 / NRRL 1006) TaxID=441959 RepID=B8LX29_TALSN|nr:uncharacterized protein TSTA_061670 [Talaromyces stipitatus ATCC 10500]EED22679.1 conserved hypothetical protein [Talaromyces stipitatus ATCC 10500]
MSWTKISSNHYRRPMGENERLIKFIGDRAHSAGREQWSVSTTATFIPSDNRSAKEWATPTLRDAWKLLRFRHPSIASTPSVDGDYLEYIVPKEDDLEDWIKETYIVVKTKNSEDVIAEMKPGPFMTLHFLPHNWEIVLHTSHWRTDGYGAFQLLNALLEAVKIVIDDGLPALPWGEEVTRLVPSVETALALPDCGIPATTASAIKYANTQVFLKDSVGVTYNGESMTRPGGTRAVRMQLSTEKTQSIQRATNERKIDMYAAIHAALAKVNLTYAKPTTSVTLENEKEYASTIRLSLRPLLISPFTENPSVAAGLYTGGYIFKVTLNDHFLKIARQYQDQYENGASSEFVQSRRQFAAMALSGLQKGLLLSNPPPSNIDISFVVGVDEMVKSGFDTKQGRLEVSRVGLGVETLTRQPCLFFWLFRGQLDLSLVYNEAYQDAEQVHKMLNGVVEVLEHHGSTYIGIIT